MAVRRKLASAASAVRIQPRLATSALPIAAPHGPSFFPIRVSRTYHQAMGRGMDQITVTCRVIAGAIDDLSRYEFMSRLQDGDGPTSLIEAIESVRAVNGGDLVSSGVADDWIVRRFEVSSEVEHAGGYYLGGELDIDVYGSGS
jgi:hypothetical protein